MRLSARNQIRGRITKIVHGSINSEVTIEIAPGIEIAAQVTSASVHDLALKEGMPAMALIKADRVLVGVEH
jgi:molybdopterin-binding protein